MTTENAMKPEVIKTIETILSRGDRVEVIPGEDGEVQVVRLVRKTELDTRGKKRPRA